MNMLNYKINIDQSLVTKIKPDYGLLVKLKKTTSCCSILVEPDVEQLSLDKILSLEQDGSVILVDENNITIAIEKEVFKIYPDYKNLEINLCGILIKKPHINLPVELIEKDRCSNE
ncbi:MAG: hypothetical protein EAX86_01285 [Candidatus Heimdallarchaeota archaeon]|nr:hypothetical protein [Candidatus Heimdallarchaeota archaeon]